MPRAISAPAASPAPPSGSQTALVALGQGSLMAFGAVLALLIARWFGRDADTDAFFAAYGVYAFGITFTQSFRLTAVPRLVEGGGAERDTLLLGAAAVLALALALPMAAAAVPLGDALVESDPEGIAPDALRILAVALAAQLFAAMLATVLTVRRAFTAIGVATLLVGLVTIATFLAVEPELGILAAAVGVAAGGAWLASVFVAVLVRGGWRPSGAGVAAVGAMLGEAGRLGFASLSFLTHTLTYVICVALAARQGPGEATLFAYAYVIAGILLGLTANVAAMVRSPAVVASRDRTAEAAAVGLWSFRFTLVLAGPVVAIVLLAGKPVVGFLLGSEFGGQSAADMLVTLACLVGWLLASAAGLFAIIELLARGELRRLAVISAVQVTAVLVLAPVGAEVAGIQGIAVGLSLATIVATALQLRSAFRERWRALAADLVRATARQLATLCLAFAVPVVLVMVLGGTAATIVAVAIAGVLTAALTLVAWPREARALLALLRFRG
jgi:putative peptidoglycan lipid II flippase